jgi:hypothetical protein
MDAVTDGRTKQRAIGGDCDGSNAFVFFRHELVGALVLCEVPDADISTSVAGDQFALVWMDHHVVHRDAMGVISLNVAATGIPDFHSSCSKSVRRDKLAETEPAIPSSELVTIHLPSQ